MFRMFSSKELAIDDCNLRLQHHKATSTDSGFAPGFFLVLASTCRHANLRVCPLKIRSKHNSLAQLSHCHHVFRAATEPTSTTLHPAHLSPSPLDQPSHSMTFHPQKPSPSHQPSLSPDNYSLAII